MRALVRITLVALLAASPISAQQLITGPTPGQVLDSVPITIGMDADEATRLLSTRFTHEPELEVPTLDASGHEVRRMGVFRRADEPVHTGSIWLTVADGRITGLSSRWKPADPSDEAFAAELWQLLGLISSPEAGGHSCEISVGGNERTLTRNSQITCGRYGILILRQTGVAPSFGLNTK